MKKFLFFLIFALLLISGCYKSPSVNDSNQVSDINQNNNTFKKTDSVEKPHFLRNYVSKRNIEEDVTRLPSRLETVYAKAQTEYSDELLKGLTPIDIFMLDLHALQLNHHKLKYHLVNAVPGYTPDLETYLNELSGDPVNEKSKQKFFLALKDGTKQIEEIIVSYNEAYIYITYKTIPNELPDCGYTFYRVEKTDQGVWKMGWLSGQ